MEAQDVAARVLPGFGAAVLEHVLPLIHHEKAHVRVRVLRILGQLKAAETLETVTAALGDENLLVRQQAVEALSCFGASDVAVIEHFIAAARDRNALVQVKALEALGGFKDERVVQPLLEATRDPNTYVCGAAIRALSALTGENLETPGQWSTWWQERGEVFLDSLRRAPEREYSLF